MKGPGRGLGVVARGPRRRPGRHPALSAALLATAAGRRARRPLTAGAAAAAAWRPPPRLPFVAGSRSRAPLAPAGRGLGARRRASGRSLDPDFAFRWDAGVVSFVAPFLVVAVLLLLRLSSAIKAKNSRLRAAITARDCQVRSSELPGDPRLLRALREAEAELARSAADEDEARGVRLLLGLAGPVVARLEVPDTVESAALEDELYGREPKVRGGISAMTTLGYAVQLALLLPTLALLLTDPLSPSSVDVP